MRLQHLLKYLLAPLLVAASVSTAQELPAPLSPYVSDYVDLLSSADEAKLEGELTRLRKEHGVEMAVVLMGARSDYASPESLEAFATRLFNTWGIGNSTRNDGILFLALIGDRETRIELGAAYGTAWEGTAARILDRDVLPHFKNGEYAKGILGGTHETIAQIALKHLEGAKPPLSDDLQSTLLLIIFGGITAFALMRRKIADKALKLRRCPKCGRRMLNVTRKITRPATRERQGEELRQITCGHCDYDASETYHTSKLSSSGRSGSFGGGRSGGGGASGRW